MRHQVVGFGLIQAFLHGALDPHQTGAELVLREFADGTHAAVAQVVDVVDLAAAVAQFHQDLDDFDDVARAQGVALIDLGIEGLGIETGGLQVLVQLGKPGFGFLAAGDVFQTGLGQAGFRANAVEFAQGGCQLVFPMMGREYDLPAYLARGIDAAVELHAADLGQVIAFIIEEQAVEQGLHGVLGGRLSGAHHAVDGDTGGPLVHRLVGAQGLGNEGAVVQFVGVQGL
jgi:hypothetical protein